MREHESGEFEVPQRYIGVPHLLEMAVYGDVAGTQQVETFNSWSVFFT